MNLSTLIRKGVVSELMTATVATVATQGAKTSGTVARVATVAVADPADSEETNPTPMTGEEEKAIRAWLGHYNERDPALIEGLLEECQRDLKARQYYLARWDEIESDSTSTWTAAESQHKRY